MISEGRPVGWHIVAVNCDNNYHGTCDECGAVGPILSCDNSCGSHKCSQCALDAMMHGSHECADVEFKVIHSPETCPGCPECDENKEQGDA